MSSRRRLPEEWRSIPRRISIRSPTQNSIGSVPASVPNKSPLTSRALRPKPLNISGKDLLQPEEGLLKTAQALREESIDLVQEPPDPEIIDVAQQEQPWTRRISHIPSQYPRREAPRTASHNSSRQSEASVGILDYYLRGPTPSIHSPDLPPPPPPPKQDPAIEAFDFGLPATPIPSANPPSSCTNKAEIVVKSDETSASLPAINQPLPRSQLVSGLSTSFNRGYSVFPTVKDITPPARRPTITLVDESPTQAIPSNSSSSPSATTSPLSPIYRPRKISLSSSVRTRNDSITSFRHKATRSLIPLRIISTDSTKSSVRTTISASTTSNYSCPSSPPSSFSPTSDSRWSDETILSSPSPAPTPGPRTSFSSLLRRSRNGNNSNVSPTEISFPHQQYSHQRHASSRHQYPACFFEEDDEGGEYGEEVPLRMKKWGSASWKGNAIGSAKRDRWSKGCYDEVVDMQGGWRRRIRRLALCGCGGR